MAISRFRRRFIWIIGLAVTVPALVLAGLGVYLTLRMARAVEAQSARFNTYMALQAADAYERELMAHLRRSAALAENAARAGQGEAAVRAALQAAATEFGEGSPATPGFVRFDDLNDYSMLFVEGQPLVYSMGQGSRSGRWFVGYLLRDPRGEVLGVGGWWSDPRGFLLGHLTPVVQERLTENPRAYGGMESTRNLSIALLDPRGRELARVRDPGHQSSARVEPLTGPFEGYSVRTAATADAPVVWTGRFIAFEILFIALLVLAMLVATVFGLIYTVRQVELAQQKASFVSNVTHELKTPIALIRLAVETLEMRRVSSPEESEKFLRSIERETARLNQLVDNILDFARLEAGRGSFRFAALDAAAVAREAVETFRPRLEDQGFQLEVSLPDGLPPVRGDSMALQHCVLNLLDNAMKYSRQRREIRLVAAARDGMVRVTVADRGIGIAPREQKRIFEKFVRLETGLVHDAKGAGLGLSLVDQIIRAHGGRVEVDSILGEGSAFTLVLPCAGEVGEPRGEPRARIGS